jgi:hypothetical protein
MCPYVCAYMCAYTSPLSRSGARSARLPLDSSNARVPPAHSPRPWPPAIHCRERARERVRQTCARAQTPTCTHYAHAHTRSHFNTRMHTLRTHTPNAHIMHTRPHFNTHTHTMYTPSRLRVCRACVCRHVCDSNTHIHALCTHSLQHERALPFFSSTSRPLPPWSLPNLLLHPLLHYTHTTADHRLNERIININKAFRDTLGPR